jgi:hypothetical protein
MAESSIHLLPVAKYCGYDLGAGDHHLHYRQVMSYFTGAVPATRSASPSANFRAASRW